MFEEIERARKRAEQKQSRQKKEDEQRMKDAEAKAVAIYKGTLVECDICAEDRPPNRMAGCNNKEKHAYCFMCVKTHIETLIGDGKHVPVCMEGGCKGRYPRQVLEQLLDKALVTRMERLQQNADLKGVKGIEECPFCNFKAMCETPSKFDCRNPECLMSSCLKCKAETHPGLSCAAHAKKKKEKDGVKQAEKAAKEKVKRENPGVTDEDLKFAMSDKVKQDDRKRLAREDRALRGEGWHFGMPIEDDEEDPEDDMFDLADMMEMMGPFGDRRRPRMGRPFVRLEDEEWDDPWDEDFVIHERFEGGGMLGMRDPFADDGFAEHFGHGRIDFDVPPRRRHRRQEQQEQDLIGRLRGDPPRVDVVRQQEAMFHHAIRDPARLHRGLGNRDRVAAERPNVGADRLAGGAQRLGRTPRSEAARAAARARPRRG
ncbi:hypothetical protein FKW77_001883 [Venturia effusa]|uniref:RING-type domain-containing protein n=1 Tax=Venturia effusa TaxID=50376 RepID=A0A517LF20_9PEZI|nr:hypothetical protein FKW77_001883 [Venturia effusa]